MHIVCLLCLNLSPHSCQYRMQLCIQYVHDPNFVQRIFSITLIFVLCNDYWQGRYNHDPLNRICTHGVGQLVTVIPRLSRTLVLELRSEYIVVARAKTQSGIPKEGLIFLSRTGCWKQDLATAERALRKPCLIFEELWRDAGLWKQCRLNSEMHSILRHLIGQSHYNLDASRVPVDYNICFPEVPYEMSSTKRWAILCHEVGARHLQRDPPHLLTITTACYHLRRTAGVISTYYKYS